MRDVVEPAVAPPLQLLRRRGDVGLDEDLAHLRHDHADLRLDAVLPSPPSPDDRDEKHNRLDKHHGRNGNQIDRAR